MAFCANCGNQVGDGVKFCPSCGTSMSGASVKAPAPVVELQADPNDAEQNKGMAIVAYILFFIPLLTGDYKKSPFVMFHTNQGAVLFITWIVVYIGGLILLAIFRGLRLWLLLPVYSLVSVIFGIALIVLLILGIINAVNGRMKPLPVIGNFKIIK